jgi:hypothetical protein
LGRGYDYRTQEQKAAQNIAAAIPALPRVRPDQSIKTNRLPVSSAIKGWYWIWLVFAGAAGRLSDETWLISGTLLSSSWADNFADFGAPEANGTLFETQNPKCQTLNAKCPKQPF